MCRDDNDDSNNNNNKVTNLFSSNCSVLDFEKFMVAMHGP